MAGDNYAPPDGDLAVEVQQKSMEELDNKMVWRQNAPLLYDLFAKCRLGQTPQSVCWLPDVKEEPSRLALGLNRKESHPSKLSILELTCLVDNDSSNAPWKAWSIEDLGAVNGFGLKGMQDQPPLRIALELTIPSDANRIAPCPTEASLLAVKGSCGKVFLFDTKRAAEPENLRATLSEENPVEGYALEWNPSSDGHLSTGGHDGLLSVWDVQSTSKLWSIKAHEPGLNDLCHSADGKQLLTVGEDCAAHIWDIRTQSTGLRFQVATEQLSVDWNLAESHLLLTGGKDGLVNIWDKRKVDAPFKSLKGHLGEVVRVKWCPSMDADVADDAPTHHFLASACAGSKTILWDMAADEPNDDGEAPEVVFIHSGHDEAVTDFGLAPLDDFLFCSVAEDDCLQLWQPAAVITEEEEPGEPDESAAKRPRIEA